MRPTVRSYVTLAFVGTVLALGAGTAGAAEPAADAGPRAVVAEPVADLGKVVKGSKPTHTFVVRNEGAAPLTIAGVEPACHCTLADFDREIAPGTAGKVTAVVDTLSLNGPGSIQLRMVSNDPQSPTTLTLNYEVVIRLQMKPGFARWASTQGEREGIIGNTVWASDGADFNVTSVESPHAYVRTAFRPATAEERSDKSSGSQWRVDLTLDQMAPVGAITGMVLVHTDHPEQKVIPLPISGFMRPVVFVFPEKGDFGTVTADKLPLRGSFKFSNFATEPIAVTGVEASIPGATATVEPVEAGREYTVKIVLPAGMPPGPFSGKVAIRTDSPKAPLVEVPVVGVVAAATPTSGE